MFSYDIYNIKTILKFIYSTVIFASSFDIVICPRYVKSFVLK